MMIPELELQMVYTKAIDESAWTKALPQPADPDRTCVLGFSFRQHAYELRFNPRTSPDIMKVSVTLPVDRALAGGELPALLRHINREHLAVKAELADDYRTSVRLSVEAIVASPFRLPDQEIATFILQGALDRLDRAAKELKIASPGPGF